MIAHTKIARRIIIFSGILLLLTGLSFRISLFWRSRAELTVFPLGDDSYYTQSHARRISQGRFFSLNDRQKSDAYFPLYTFICAILHRLSGDDRFLGIKYALGLNFVIFLGCLVAVGIISSRILLWLESRVRRMFCLLGIGLYASSIIIFSSDMNLMETGLQLFISLWILYQTLFLYQKQEKSDKDFIFLSFLFTLACLTRIDMALFVSGYSLVMLFFRKEWGLNKKRLAIMIIPPALVSIGWLIVSCLAKGYWLPTGGATAFIFSWPFFLGNAKSIVSMLLHFFLGFFHSGTSVYPRLFWSSWWNHHSVLKNFLLLTYFFILLSIIAYFLRGQPFKKEKLKLFFSPLVVFASGVLLQVVFYTFYYERNYFFGRYFTIIVPLFLFFWLIIFALLLQPQDLLKDYNRKLVFVTLLLIFHFLIFIYTQHRTFETLRNDYKGYWGILEWTKRSTQPQDSVASCETGILGYWRDNVINLDGKTNVDASKAIRSGRYAHYVIKIRPKYIVDLNIVFFHRYFNNLPLVKNPLFLEHYEFVQETPFHIWKRKED